MENIVKEELAGRLLKLEECSSLLQKILLSNEIDVDIFPGYTMVENTKKCVRCGSAYSEYHCNGPCLCDNEPCYYCTACLQMGKIKSCTNLYHVVEATPAFPKIKHIPIVYKASLSELQQQVSSELKEIVLQSGYRRHLIWAVTGAGKTEMIFEAIQACIQQGGRVAIASPRIDVCLELAPRLLAAFPTVEQIVLYGSSEMKYRRVPLSILTTHQLLRFKAAFDLLIIDEVDAFPYSNSEMLQYGASQALKSDGKLFYLTATPSKAIQKEIERKNITKTILSARYHRYPLVTPKTIWVGNWSKNIQNKKLPKSLRKWINRQFECNKPFLLFVPKIELLKPLSFILKKYYPDKEFEAVSSQEALRKEYVQKMRDGELDFLLTTTILERGVTFFDIQVAVLGAEDDIFSREVLVQIAGRVGRSPLAPRGNVSFFHYGKTKAIKSAIKEINLMNHLAKQEGLLYDEMPVVSKE